MKHIALTLTLLALPFAFACQTGSVAETAPPTVAAEAPALNGVAFINWNIANEVNLQEFRVYQSDSEDGPFELLQTIPAKGPGIHGNQSYGFEERGLEVGSILYFKVEYAYVNGETSVVGPVGYEVKPEEM